MEDQERLQAIGLAVLDSLQTAATSAKRPGEQVLTRLELERLVELGAWDHDSFHAVELLGGVGMLLMSTLRATGVTTRQQQLEVFARIREDLGHSASG